MSAVNTPKGLAKVSRLNLIARPGMDRLRKALGGLSDMAMGAVVANAQYQAVKNPRVPQKISVNTNGLSSYAIGALAAAELISDEGLVELIKAVAELATEYPAQNAEILTFELRN